MGKSDADEAPTDARSVPVDAALVTFPPGETLCIEHGAVSVDIAPEAGGRVAQIRCDGIEWLQGYSDDSAAMIAWGCFPMVPWAGRVRRGRFDFAGSPHQLPVNLGPHAIHGLGFALPWRVEAQSSHRVDLSLQLPEDARWPFGGRAIHRIEAGARSLRMTLSLRAGAHAMPAVIGWHPWLYKPERVDFTPSLCYPRDAEDIATLPLCSPPPPPWDDCFVNHRPILVRRAGQTLRLTSGCGHWVIYDELANVTCIEPQTGPPDAFNIEPALLVPGATCSAWFQWEWL